MNDVMPDYHDHNDVMPELELEPRSPVSPSSCFLLRRRRRQGEAMTLYSSAFF